MYEYVLYSPGKYHSTEPHFVSVDETPSEGFSSLYRVNSATAKAIIEEGTTRQFKGVVWSPSLVLDFDSYEAAERAERRLIEMELKYDAYDSGGRGAHFYIARDHAPSHILPLKDKQWVKANFPEADGSIYTHLHLFRLAGTTHEKTGHKKELVNSREGRVLTLPKFDFVTSVPVATQVTNNMSVFNNFRIMAETMPQTGGQRHYSMVKLCYALKEHGIDEQTALFWLGETNKLYKEPKEYGEVEKIVQSIFRG